MSNTASDLLEVFHASLAADGQELDVAAAEITDRAVITEANRDAWLAERRKSIGASEAAAALGLSQWKTPIELWQKKTGRAQPDPENEYMRLGTLMEPVVRTLYETHAEGFPLAAAQVFVRHSALPFLTATLDGVVSDRRLVEFKTAWRYSEEWGDEDSDNVPDSYLIQCQQQMACAGAQVVDLAALIMGKFRIYRIARDERLIGRMEQKLTDFWACVVNDVPPTWGKITAKELGIINPLCDGETELPPDVWAEVIAYRDAKGNEKASKDAADRAKVRVLSAMGNAKFGVVNGERIVQRYLYEVKERTQVVKGYTNHFIKALKGDE